MIRAVKLTEKGAAAAVLLGKIAAAAIEVDRVRERTAMAYKARQRHQCRLESNVAGGPKGSVFRDPCWKMRREVAVYHDAPDLVPVPRSEWCDRCIRRQAAHDRYVELRNELAGARRRLTYHVRRFRREYGDQVV